MSLSSQRHANLYRSKEVLCVHEEVHERLKVKSIDRGFVWQSTSPQYHQPPLDEWEEDLDNEEVE